MFNYPMEEQFAILSYHKNTYYL